jgi:hypothetical protein
MVRHNLGEVMESGEAAAEALGAVHEVLAMQERLQALEGLVDEGGRQWRGDGHTLSREP